MKGTVSSDDMDKTCLTIGRCSASSVVQWEYVASLPVALTLFSDYEAKRRNSVVLFHDDVPFRFASIHHIDVACILQAYQQESSRNNSWNLEESTTQTVVDRQAVEHAVMSGDAPSVAPTYGKVVQWSLKRCMDVLFWRESVHFFSAGPYRNSSRCYWDVEEFPAVRGHVALTFDDAPCRFSNRENSLLPEVLDTLREYNALATFMVVGKFIVSPSNNASQHERDLISLLQQGHELGNHGMADRRYDLDTPDEFAAAVDECNKNINLLQRKAQVTEQVQFFRAPHAKYTRQMAKVLESRGLTNVMCDTFASCPIVQDGEYIGSTLSRRAQHGSIILLHMPERGHRDWCMVGLRRLLVGLRQRNMTVVTVGMLQVLAALKNQPKTEELRES